MATIQGTIYNDNFIFSAGRLFPSLFGTAESDNIFGNAGDDILYALGGDDSLYGGEGNDKLYGNDDSDFLTGGDGNDFLTGGNGNDILAGGAGNDSLTGSSGTDQFLYDTGKPFATADIGIDQIDDFVHNVDKIVLDKTTFTSINSAPGTGFSNPREFNVVIGSSDL